MNADPLEQRRTPSNPDDGAQEDGGPRRKTLDAFFCPGRRRQGEEEADRWREKPRQPARGRPCGQPEAHRYGEDERSPASDDRQQTEQEQGKQPDKLRGQQARNCG